MMNWRLKCFRVDEDIQGRNEQTVTTHRRGESLEAQMAAARLKLFLCCQVNKGCRFKFTRISLSVCLDSFFFLLLRQFQVKLNQIKCCFFSRILLWPGSKLCYHLKKTESNSNVPPPLNAGLWPCHHRCFFFSPWFSFSHWLSPVLLRELQEAKQSACSFPTRAT